MKLTKYTMRKLTLALSLGAALISATATQAADLILQVQVRGYSGYTLVVTGSNTGGRVQWSSRYNCNITDRVSRGESACFTIAPTASGEYLYQGGLTQAFSLGSGYLPCYRTFTVPTDPNKDNLYMWASTNCGYFQKRMPIGTR